MTPALCTPGISSVHRPAPKHSVPTETHSVAQGVTGTRDQGTCVLIIPESQGGSHSTRPPDPGGVWALSRAVWEEVSLWLCWGPDPLLEGPTHPQDFPSSKAPHHHHPGQQLAGDKLACRGCSVSLGAALLPSWSGPCRVLFSGTGTGSSGEQNPQGFKVSVGHGLIQMTKGPPLLLALVLFAGPISACMSHHPKTETGPQPSPCGGC